MPGCCHEKKELKQAVLKKQVTWFPDYFIPLQMLTGSVCKSVSG